MDFEHVARGRRSVRAFLPIVVPPEFVREILNVAARSPSGTNVQPSRIHVVPGVTRDILERDILAHRAAYISCNLNQ